MNRIFVALSVCLALALGTLITGAASADVADDIIAIAKAQWAAEMKKDWPTAMKNVADEYTEFNFTYSTRLDGKALNQRLMEAQLGASSDIIAAEMANEKVQVYGDTAILTYNFVGASKDKDGAVEALLAKSTRVYVKQNKQWMLVHANFAADE